ncbi:hypothetical protein ACFQ60_02915 [Streptomyces zhihengii]
MSEGFTVRGAPFRIPALQQSVRPGSDHEGTSFEAGDGQRVHAPWPVPAAPGVAEE